MQGYNDFTNDNKNHFQQGNEQIESETNSNYLVFVSQNINPNGETTYSSTSNTIFDKTNYNQVNESDLSHDNQPHIQVIGYGPLEVKNENNSSQNKPQQIRIPDSNSDSNNESLSKIEQKNNEQETMQIKEQILTELISKAEGDRLKYLKSFLDCQRKKDQWGMLFLDWKYPFPEECFSKLFPGQTLSIIDVNEFNKLNRMEIQTMIYMGQDGQKVIKIKRECNCWFDNSNQQEYLELLRTKYGGTKEEAKIETSN